MNLKSSIIFLLLLSLLNSQKIEAQIYLKSCVIDSLEVCLQKIENDYNTIASLFAELDSLASDNLIDYRLFKSIASTILNNGITEGYVFVLNNSNKYKTQKYMKPHQMAAGKTAVILDVIKYMKGDKISKFIDYILYSDYLNQKLSPEQLKHLSSIINYKRNELYEVTHKSSLRESNLQTIYKINTKD